MAYGNSSGSSRRPTGRNVGLGGQILNDVKNAALGKPTPSQSAQSGRLVGSGLAGGRPDRPDRQRAASRQAPDWRDNWQPKPRVFWSVRVWLAVCGILFVASLLFPHALGINIGGVGLLHIAFVLALLGYPIFSLFVRNDPEYRHLAMIVADEEENEKRQVYNLFLQVLLNARLITDRSDPSWYRINVVHAGEPDIIEFYCREWDLKKLEPVFNTLVPHLEADHCTVERMTDSDHPNNTYRIVYRKSTPAEEMSGSFDYMDYVMGQGTKGRR